MRGVLLIATKKRQYGEMAFNLAVSLRLAFPDLPITVISDGQIEKVDGYELLVDTIPAPDHDHPYELKPHIYKLTPYRETLYLDADTIYLGRRAWEWPDKEAKLLIPSSGRIKADQSGAWINLESAYARHKIGGEYPLYNSSLIYFRKSRETSRFFKAARDFHANPERVIVGGLDAYPDEVSFGLASVKTGLYGDGEKPIVWPGLTLGSATMILASYSFLTLSGPTIPNHFRNIYNGTVKRNGDFAGYPAFPVKQ